MIGVSVVADEYVAFEPSIQTHSGLLQLHQFLSAFRPEFGATVQNMPYEDSLEREDYYDFALTSPPYFDTERYADEDTQSFMRYRTFSSWDKNFFTPLIHKTMRQLKPSCTFVLNVGSRKWPLNQCIERECDGLYSVRKLGNLLSGSGGLGKDGEGEMFYAITKPEFF